MFFKISLYISYETPKHTEYFLFREKTEHKNYLSIGNGNTNTLLNLLILTLNNTPNHTHTHTHIHTHHQHYHAKERHNDCPDIMTVRKVELIQYNTIQYSQ